MKKQLSNEAKGAGNFCIFLLSVLAGLFAGFALLIWIIMYLTNPDNPVLGGTSIALAPAVAIVGIFGWTGGMSSKGNPMLRAELRKIGILHTATALFWVVMGMILPILQDKYSEVSGYQIFAGVYVALLFVSSVTFGVGTGKFAYILLDLWNIQDK